MMGTRRVVCTGLGTVSPLGVGVQESWSALLSSKSGITKLKNCHSFQGSQSNVAAYVPDDRLTSELESEKHIYIQKNTKQLSRASIFAMLSAHEALEHAKLLDNSGHLFEKFRERCGVAIGQGMVDFQDIYDNGTLIKGEDNKRPGYKKMSPFFMTRALINMSAGNVSLRYKLYGPNHCVSTACATGAHSIGDACDYIRLGRSDIMVCGSTEASINSIAMAGFERLRALSTKFNDNPPAASRPFDTDRCGFVMGEGAGIMILEDYEHALKRGVKEDDILGEILGYGTSADAHHLTAPSPDGQGAGSCMRAAIRDANIGLSEVSHVNAHATSTPLGDDIECNAIEELFYSPNTASHVHNNKITVTSCKSSIGHLLGGSGSVESIFAILSCQNGILPHCLNLNNPLVTQRNKIEFIRDTPREWTLDTRILVKNSFGFGGTNASIVMSNLV